MNKEVVIISDLSESSGGTFAATAHVEARFSSYFHILFASCTLQISHVKASFSRKNLGSWKIMSGRKLFFFRLSHNVVTCDVDRDVSAAYC